MNPDDYAILEKLRHLSVVHKQDVVFTEEGSWLACGNDRFEQEGESNEELSEYLDLMYLAEPVREAG